MAEIASKAKPVKEHFVNETDLFDQQLGVAIVAPVICGPGESRIDGMCRSVSDF